MTNHSPITAHWTPEQFAHLNLVKAANPSILIDPERMNLFAAQAICKTMPNDPTKEQFLFYYMMVAETNGVDAVLEGRFDETCAIAVPKETEVIVVPPSVVYFLDGKIRRGVQMAVAYATITAIKLCRLAGGNPKIVLASPDKDVELTIAEAVEGLNRQMRLEIGDVVTMPSATSRGPLWTEKSVVDRIEARFPPDMGV